MFCFSACFLKRWAFKYQNFTSGAGFMILCLIDLDICDKVLSPYQTEAFLTEFIYTSFFFFHFHFHFSCLQFATMSDSTLRRKLAWPQFWYQFSSLISQDKAVELKMKKKTIVLDAKLATPLVGYPTALWGLLLNCILQAGAHCACCLPAVSQDDHQTCVSICTLVISHPLPEGLDMCFSFWTV